MAHEKRSNKKVIKKSYYRDNIEPVIIGVVCGTMIALGAILLIIIYL